MASYRDAMKLLLTWFRDAERIPPEKLRLADIGRPRVLRFLDWLEAERGCLSRAMHLVQAGVNLPTRHSPQTTPAGNRAGSSPAP